MNRVMQEIPGLVWAYRFPDGGGPASALGLLDRGEVLEGQGFLWLHLALSDARVPAFLGLIEGLSHEAVQTLTGRDGHPAADVDGGVLHGVFVDFQRTFDEETRDFGSLRFAACDRFLITTRLSPLHSVDRARSIIERTAHVAHPFQILETVIGEFRRALQSLVVEVTDELNLIEDHVFDDIPRDERRRLGPVRRIVVRLHRHLRAGLAMFRAVECLDEADAPARMRQTAERLADAIERVDRDVFSLQERARLLHEEIDSKISSETNRHLYIVSVMTAFLLPPTLVAGVFGMNTRDLPWVDAPGGTWYALGLCGLSIVGAWWLLRRAGIL